MQKGQINENVEELSKVTAIIAEKFPACISIQRTNGKKIEKIWLNPGVKLCINRTYPITYIEVHKFLKEGNGSVSLLTK